MISPCAVIQHMLDITAKFAELEAFSAIPDNYHNDYDAELHSRVCDT